MAEAAPRQTGFRENYFSAQDGLRLYYRDYGPHGAERATVLCLPGLTRNARDFHDIALKLSGTRRVLCPDYRGRGRSDYDPDWRHYEPRVLVDDVRHLLDSTDTEGAVAIGVSLGGLLAVALAVAMPGKLRAIVLDDVGPTVETRGLGRILAWVRDPPPQPDWPQATEVLRRMFVTLSFSTDEEWLNFARATYRLDADGLLHADWDPNLIKPYENGDHMPDGLWTLYRGVAKLPMLAVRGGASDVLSEATFRRMKEEKPDLIQVTVPGVGHVPTMAEPAAAGPLAAFLDRF